MVLVKSTTVVTSRVFGLYLTRVPTPSEPQLAVIPYKLPSLAIIMLASGEHPFVPLLKLYSVSTTPAVLIEKIVPLLPNPPWEEVPTNDICALHNVLSWRVAIEIV